MVVIGGGAPLLHLAAASLAESCWPAASCVTVCTNPLLMEKPLEQYKPHLSPNWSVHLDGLKPCDTSVCQTGVYDKAVAAVRARRQGGGHPRQHRLHPVQRRQARAGRGLLDALRALGVDGGTISPGYF